MNLCPTITTNRLITRKLQLADSGVWAAFFPDEAATKFFPPPGETDPVKRADAWIEKQLTRYTGNSGGLQALIHTTTGELIGQCGLLVQHIDGMEEIEIGYHILPRFWKQGYATEAAIAFKEYAVENKLAPSLISIIHKDNIASQKVAVKNGMQSGKASLFHGLEVVIYRLQLDRR